MPRYRVTEVGFFGGVMYDPDGKRRVLTTDAPFKKDEIPSWVDPKPIKDETAAERKKRLAAEKQAAEKKSADDKEIADASFMGEGEAAAGSTVETL